MEKLQTFDSLVSKNDFVIKFANVNGSGSASANQMFAKAVFRMGIPVSPKNIFPSNIQGLPTWFEIRINKNGYLGSKGSVDLSVAMNPQSYNQDVEELNSGGYLLYDSSWKRNFYRDDINVIEIPLTSLCVESFTNAKQRALFKNIAYVGALSVLLDMEYEIFEELISEQFASKKNLIEPNLKALNIGRDYVLNNLPYPIGLTLERMDKNDGKILISGNEAAGLGAVYEDELSAIGMAIGANWNGARSFTATSGPGISLMSEFLGLAYFAEVPVVVFDVQRGGPSTGMPTKTQQSDILACAYASHGDTKHVMLLPEDPKECFEFSAMAFDLADRLQTPVFVVTDLDMGMNDWVVDELEWDDSRKFDRGKVLDFEALEKMEEKFGRYHDVDGDGICYRTYPGAHPSKGAYFTRGTSHDKYARYSEDGEINATNLRRLVQKFKTASELVPDPEIILSDKKNCSGVIYYGSTSAAMIEARDMLKEEGIELDLMRVKAFPFNLDVWDFIEKHDYVYVVEQNRDSQMRTLLMAEGGISAEKLRSLVWFNGQPIEANFIAKKIREREPEKI